MSGFTLPTWPTLLRLSNVIKGSLPDLSHAISCALFLGDRRDRRRTWWGVLDLDLQAWPCKPSVSPPNSVLGELVAVDPFFSRLELDLSIRLV